MKKIIIVLVLILLVLLFRAFKDDVMVFNQQTEKQDEELYLIASIPEKDTFLYSSLIEQGSYKNMMLKIGEKEKTYDWKTIKSDTFIPLLKYIDVSREGVLKEDLGIILTITTGTGVYITDVHIINPNTMNEIEVDNPINVINDTITMEITPQGVKIVIAGVIYLIPNEFIASPKHWYSKPGVGGHIVFELENNQLTARVGIQISPTIYIGTFKIYYTFIDNKYKITNIEYHQSL